MTIRHAQDQTQLSTLHTETVSHKYRSNTTYGLDISGDWWPQAELVDRSLPAYTPAPSNPSFMGAFVQVKREWLPLFGRGFELRCFQLLSTTAWLPGDCLIRQPVN